MPSPGGRATVTGGIGLGSGSGSAPAAANRSVSVDIDYLPTGHPAPMVNNRSLKLPMPLPSNHDDVLHWHLKLLDCMVSTNYRNMEREKSYWN